MRVRLLALLLIAAGCKGGGSEEPAPSDAAPLDAQPDVAPIRDAAPDVRQADAAPATPICACEPEEDCTPCYRRIGQCCYGDPALRGQLQRVADTCTADPACRACCAECAARSCEEIHALGDCPPA